MANSIPFFLLLLLLLDTTITLAASSEQASRNFADPFVGFNIGTSVSDLLSATDLATFLKSKKITHVRLYQPDADILLALAGTQIRVALGVPNNQLLALGSSPTTAARWVSHYVTPFHNKTIINLVTVGDEVLTSSPGSSPLLLKAMRYIHAALSAAGLSGEIKVSTPHSASVILNPFPPSQALFNQSTVRSYLYPILRFLAKTSSPLVLNLYPYYVFMKNRHVVPLDNALFKQLPPSREEVDPNTLLHYTNVFTAMIDAAYFAMKNLNISDVSVLVGETGWPSNGDPKREPFATKDNADTYNSNLIKSVLVDRRGTPMRPDVTPSVYIYELFNEDLRAMPAVSEANWGLFYGNTTPVYLLHVSGSGGFLGNDTTNKTFCVVADGVAADSRTVQTALDWACGPGRADCSEIQPGENCYEANNLKRHASYAFDSYYEKEGKVAGSCYFQGAAMVTTTDPSEGNCIFPGSKDSGVMSAGAAVNNSWSSSSETSNASQGRRPAVGLIGVTFVLSWVWAISP